MTAPVVYGSDWSADRGLPASDLYATSQQSSIFSSECQVLRQRVFRCSDFLIDFPHVALFTENGNSNKHILIAGHLGPEFIAHLQCLFHHGSRENFVPFVFLF